MSTKLEVDTYERKISILIEDLRLWILSQPHLHSRIDDEFLRGFLRSCYLDLSEAQTRLDLFYTLKSEIPSVLSERKVTEELLDICRIGISVFLPGPLNGKNYRTNFSKYPGSLIYGAVNFAEVIKLFFMISEMHLVESRFLGPPERVVYVIDMEAVTFKESLKIDFGLSKKIVRLIEHGLPLQIEEVHFLNVSKYFKCILHIACKLLKKNLRKKVHIHMYMDSLYKYIPMEFLPLEYGGKNGNLSEFIKQQIERLVNFKQYFEQDVLFVVNETLRRKPC